MLATAWKSYRADECLGPRLIAQCASSLAAWLLIISEPPARRRSMIRIVDRTRFCTGRCRSHTPGAGAAAHGRFDWSVGSKRIGALARM